MKELICTLKLLRWKYISRKLVKQLNYIRTHKNRGLLAKAIFNMYGVQQGRIRDSFAYSSVTLLMNDGYEIECGRELFNVDNIRHAAREVAQWARKRYKPSE